MIMTSLDCNFLAFPHFCRVYLSDVLMVGLSGWVSREGAAEANKRRVQEKIHLISRNIPADLRGSARYDDWFRLAACP